MKKILFGLTLFLTLSGTAVAQLLSWAPAFTKDNDNITIIMDASRGDLGLFNYSNVTDIYVHTGVITNLSTGPTDWRYSKFAWGTTNPAAQATSLGGNRWQYTISNIRSFYGVPSGETIQRVAILFRNGAGTAVQRNADASDMYIPIYDNTLGVRFTTPFYQPTLRPIPEPILRQSGQTLSVTAGASASCAMRIWLNGTEIQSATNVTSLTATATITSGTQVFIAEGNDGTHIRRDTFSFQAAASLPAGVRDGINYEAGNTSVVLVLRAPFKARVCAIGEFPGSSWREQAAFQMTPTPDGNYWWLRITGLTPGTEYAFQYLVDGGLKTGDPYAEKILDPNHDGAITPATFPNLKSYPTGQTTGIVSVLQPGAPAYNWAVPNFNRPDKRNLVIYELLLRDFMAAHDWKTLRDTLRYLKNLGVNAIQVMPFNEFDANESWGYNPSYFMAPDKYYGPANTLREFIDSCHRNGMAVIMDAVLNHTTGNNPLAALYWNSTSNQPAPHNPWLNVTATHPYNVFNDFNHESLATRAFTGRFIEHWLQQYKLDGFRWDLSKGFTQNAQCGGSTTNEGCLSDYHADRVAIWKRYYDTMQLKAPGSYCILEHFAANSEESELSDYGMLIWGNHNPQFKQAAMGFGVPDPSGNTWNFEGYLHSVRGWSKPHLVSYMESHDEERLMYYNLQFGNSSGSYSVRNLVTGLKRIELSGAFLLAAPGPKMIWQFGELGYDQSINRCTDGTVNPNCRLDNKPILWNYFQEVQRRRVYDIFAALNKLRFHPWYRDVFIANNTTISRNLGGSVKTLVVRSATDSSMLCVIGNFDVTAQSLSFTFPAAGTWYSYLNGGTFNATGGSQTLNLQPGEYHVFLNRNLVNAVVTSDGGPRTNPAGFQLRVFPNPLSAACWLELTLPEPERVRADLYDVTGQHLGVLLQTGLNRGVHRIPLEASVRILPAGRYWVRITSAKGSQTTSFIKP